MKIVCFLQNAWSRFYAGGVWPRDSWLRALRLSRSGQRLAVLDGLDVWFDNTTPVVGDCPSSVVRPDLGHIRGVLRSQSPDFVLACGSQAGRCLLEVGVGVPLLIVPHPAYRVVTNRLFSMARNMLVDGFCGVCELKQLNGSVSFIQRTK